MAHSRVHIVFPVKHKTLQNEAVERKFQVGRLPIPSTECGNRESPVTNLLTRSWYDQVTVTPLLLTVTLQAQQQ